MRMSARRICVLIASVAIAVVPVVAVAGDVQHGDLVSVHPATQMPVVVQEPGGARPSVDALAELGDLMVAGGNFTSVEQQGHSVRRSRVMAFDRLTGELTGFAPTIEGGSVFALAADPVTNSIYVGGSFTKVNGQDRVALVKLDATSGEIITSFSARFSRGQVNDLELIDLGGQRRLIVAGSFNGKLVSLNPQTGRNDGYLDVSISDPIPNAWGSVSIYRFAIDPTRTHLAATGNFMTVSGQSRTRFFMLDLSTQSRLSSWYYPGFAKRCSSTAPRRIAYLQGLDWSPDGQYFSVAATGQIPANRNDIWYQHLGDANRANTTLCDGVGRFSLMNPTQPVWINYTGGDSVWSVSDTGVAVYTAGHFKWVDNPDGWASMGIGNLRTGEPAARRSGLAAIDPQSGRALAWNPGLTAANKGGKTFLADEGGLWMGNDSTRYAGVARRGLVYAPLP